jgi:hypothetical protein
MRKNVKMIAADSYTCVCFATHMATRGASMGVKPYGILWRLPVKNSKLKTQNSKLKTENSKLFLQHFNNNFINRQRHHIRIHIFPIDKAK